MKQPIIEIVPVGELSPDSLQNLPPSLKERFPGREIKLASQELAHPDYAFSRTRKHYQSGPILEKLTHFDPQAERILGVTDLDLFTPGLNFIFGQAQLNGHHYCPRPPAPRILGPVS
jgi:archaemetzincin